MRTPIYYAAVIGFCLFLQQASGQDVDDGTELVKRTQLVDAAISTIRADNPKFAEALWNQLHDAISDVEDQLDPVGRHQARSAATQKAMVFDVHKMIDRLADEEESKLSPIREKLRRLEEAWKDGSLFLPDAEKPLVQWAHAMDLGQSGRQHLRQDGRQVVPIRVTDIGRPSIIALSSSRATDWQLQLEDSANVAAVLILNNADVVTCDAPLLTYRRRGYGRQITAESRAYLRQLIAFEVGQPVDLMFPVYHLDQQVEFSTNNAEWTRAYVHGQLLHLQAELQSDINDRFAATYSDLRFPGLITERERYTGKTSLAEFSLRGPVVGSIKPTGLSLWNHVSLDTGHAFGLTHGGSLAEWSDRMDKWVQLGMPPQLYGGTFFRSMCWDKKRKGLRFIDYEGGLHAFDPKTSQWSFIRRGVQDFVCLTYREADDTLIALRQQESREIGREGTKTISVVFLSAADGNIVRELPTDCRVSIQSFHERASCDLTVTDDFLIAVQPPSGGQRAPARSVIRVFDLNNGELLYSYMLPAKKGFEQPQKSPPQETDKTRYAVFAERLRLATQSVAALENSHLDQFEQLTKKLDSLRNPTTFLRRKSDKPIVHWIRTFNGPVPPVKVTDTSGPIVIALSSFNNHEWQLQINEGVDLVEVLFVGGEIPKILGVPKGVPIRIHSSKDVAEADRAVERQPHYQRSVIQKMVPARLATELDLNRILSQSIVTIGPGDADWAVQRVLDDLNQVVRTATQLLSRTKLPESFRFAYLYNGELPKFESSGPPYVVECNLHGPILQTARTLDADFWANSIALVAPGKFVIGNNEDGLHQAKRSSEGLAVTPISSAANQTVTREIMYDEESERLFCLTPSGLHIRDKQQRWDTRRVFATPAVAWCHDDEKNCFYTLLRKSRQIVEVHEISEDGTTVRKRKLPVPIDCQFKAGARLFFAYCESGHIILVMRNGLPRDSATNRVVVLDADSLNVVHEGPFKPHIEREVITETEFNRLWQQLATVDEVGAVAVMWQLAAGVDTSAERIKSRLGIVEQLSQEEVETLVAQLDASTFASRDEAFHQLSKAGKSHAAYLRGLPRASLSPEQSSRIRGLLGYWQDSSIRSKRAHKVLEMIERQ